MKIKNGILEEINMEDIKEHKVVIPDGVSEIGTHAFYGNFALNDIYQIYEIILPDSIKKISHDAFRDCYSLKRIKLPKDLKTIPERAFQNCHRLEEIILPEGLEKIDSYAFDECHQLTKINLPNSITEIEDGAFSNCKHLENIEIPEKLEKINDDVFQKCPIKKIVLPSSIRIVGDYAFDYKKAEEITLPSNLSDFSYLSGKINNLRKINTEWGSYEIPESHLIDGREIIDIYLFLYANHLVKEKYTSLEDMKKNKFIKEILLNNGGRLDVFKDIFYKTRKSYDVPREILEQLSRIKKPKEFSYSVWNRIKNAFPYENNYSMRIALARIIEVFGLFKKDKNQEKRIQTFLNLFDLQNYILLGYEYQELIEGKKELAKYFEKTDIQWFKLNKLSLSEETPEEFYLYLSGRISLEKRRKIKKLSGTFGKKINDYINQNYNLETEEIYQVKKEYLNDRFLKNLLFQSDFFGKLNQQSMHRMFDEQLRLYNEDFYNFFIENLPFILDSINLQSHMKTIERKFPAIKKFYLRHSGIEKITLVQAMDYINNDKLIFDKGNFEFMDEAKKAGVNDQETFDFYQTIYNRNKTRQMSSLIKRSNVFEIDGFMIKAELLRKDDGFSILVGETNYTNCCQIFNGVGHNCMAHATGSDDGGIFVTKLLKDGEWILLTESWDWQNNNLYCHDNIEGTEYLKTHPELKKVVAKAFKLDAETIIEKSKTEVASYIKERKRRIEKSLVYDKEKELKKLDELAKRQVIKVVTSGFGYDDLGLDKIFNQSFYADEERFIHGEKFTLSNFQPVEYDSSKPYFDPNRSAYSDAKSLQYILAGSLEDLVLSKEKIEPIYRDERKVILEEENIRDYTVEKIVSIEDKAYPEEMKVHGNENKHDFSKANVYIGEDWYLIYEIREYDHSIYISDLARVEPTLEDERGKQLQEIMSVIRYLVNNYDKVKADLKEDTSYILYLTNKHLGYIEQIGEDVSYPFDNEHDKRVISEEEQQEILKNYKKQEQKNSLIMHNIAFRKNKKLEIDSEKISKK